MIVKEQHYNKVVDVFTGSKVKVTSERKRHPGAVIDNEVSCAKSLVDDWIKQSKLLSIIAESEPPSAYLTFVGGFKGKLFCVHDTVVRRVVKTITRYYPF